MPSLVKLGRGDDQQGATGLDDGDRMSGILPTAPQRAYLSRGLDQPGGKLPLFDENGRRYDPRTIRACIDHGWAEPWFANPQKPDWQVCRLTPLGREVLARETRAVRKASQEISPH